MGDIKLGDFGACQTPLPSDSVSDCGSAPYKSPDRLKTNKTEKEDDLWALGVTLHVITTGLHPLEALCPNILIGQLIPKYIKYKEAGSDKIEVSRELQISEQLLCLVESCLVFERRQPSISELLKLDFVKNSTAGKERLCTWLQGNMVASANSYKANQHFWKTESST